MWNNNLHDICITKFVNPSSAGDFACSAGELEIESESWSLQPKAGDLASMQDESSNGSFDDTFLAIQRATSTVGKIYNDFFALSRADFFSCLSECCNYHELRYVRYMMVCP